MYDECIALLKSRGVEIKDIVDCVLFIQKEHNPNIDVLIVEKSIEMIISKREVQHAILTGIELDLAQEEGTIHSQRLNDILKDDASLYGVDEVLAYGICNIYGSIALTNFGYIDRVKPGIIGKLNDDSKRCNTFLDDIVGAIAASAASRIAHGK